jgi:hypothetical protein
MLDEPPHVQKRILPQPQRQPPRHPLNETDQTITNLYRRHLELDRRLHSHLLKR